MSIELGIDTFGDVTRDESGRALTHGEVLRNVVEEAVLADDVGLDVFGVGEHHRPDFAISSPEALLGVIAGRTNRIKLASAVTVLSSDDPVRVYQRFATLAVASNGRAEIILGRGSFTESFPLFGYPLDQYELLFEEKLELFAAILRGATDAEPVTWQGRTRAPMRNQRVFPALDRPLPVWIGVGGSPESVARAAHYGFPLTLAIIGGDPRRFIPFVQLYHELLDQRGVPRPPVAIHSHGYVAESDEQAKEELWAPYREMRDRIGSERGWPPMMRREFEQEIAAGSLYAGSPETVADRIVATVRALGAQRFHMKYSAGALSHEKMMRCIELFGREVAPRVRAGFDQSV